MPVATVKQLCTPSSLVTSDSLVEQVAQIEDFASGKINGEEFFRRNYFTDGLRRLGRARALNAWPARPTMARFI